MVAGTGWSDSCVRRRVLGTQTNVDGLAAGLECAADGSGARRFETPSEALRSPGLLVVSSSTAGDLALIGSTPATAVEGVPCSQHACQCQAFGWRLFQQATSSGEAPAAGDDSIVVNCGAGLKRH
jgi:hypothetical protein